MEIEIDKCQHLCCECHIKETIRREEENKINNTYKYINHIIESKKIFINSYKERGCCLCGYNDILKFLEFDHLNPSTKTENISRMMNEYTYSQSEMEIEMNKCRLLYKYCHIFHTKVQVENGDIKNYGLSKREQVPKKCHDDRLDQKYDDKKQVVKK